MTIIGVEVDTSAAGNFSLTMFDMKTFLVANSWTVLASGNGISGSYSAVGDVIGDVAAMGVEDAWFVIQPPNGRWQLLVVTGSASFRGTVCVSENASFSDGGGPFGAASRSIPWGAPNQMYLVGSHIATGSWANGSSSDIVQIITSDVVIEGQYPLYVLRFDGTAVAEGFGIDPVLEETAHPDMLNNLVMWQESSGSPLGRCLFYGDVTDTTSPVYGQDANLTGQLVRPTAIYASDGEIQTDVTTFGTVGELMFPMGWMQTAAITGSRWDGDMDRMLGVSALMRVAQTAGVTHAYPDRSNAAAANAKLFMSPTYLVPWRPGVTPT